MEKQSCLRERKKSQRTLKLQTNRGSKIYSSILGDIYLVDADGKNPKILLPSVGTIYDLKWSPVDENLILFGGTSFDNVNGVWLLNMRDSSIRRVWTQNTLFDWSPDGSRIVLLDNNTGSWWSGITIIDIVEQ